MIEVTELHKAYGEHQVLRGLSFKVAAGELTGFLGANGAGKTSCLDIICGCRQADRGEVVLAGHHMAQAPLAAKRLLGYLPEQAPLHPDMTVRECIEFAAGLHGLRGPTLRQRVAEGISRLQLTAVASRLIAVLSKGYRQRVVLAQALVHKPAVLVLDEPTDGLDPEQLQTMRALLSELASDHTVLLSSHSLAEVELLCKRLHILAGGRLVASGTPSELAASQLEAYDLLLARAPEQYMASLPPLAGLSAELQGSGVIHLRFARALRERCLDHLTAHAVRGDFGLRGLTPKPPSLEQCFLQAIGARRSSGEEA